MMSQVGSNNTGGGPVAASLPSIVLATLTSYLITEGLRIQYFPPTQRPRDPHQDTGKADTGDSHPTLPTSSAPSRSATMPAEPSSFTSSRASQNRSELAEGSRLRCHSCLVDDSILNSEKESESEHNYDQASFCAPLSVV